MQIFFSPRRGVGLFSGVGWGLDWGMGWLGVTGPGGSGLPSTLPPSRVSCPVFRCPPRTGILSVVQNRCSNASKGSVDTPVWTDSSEEPYGPRLVETGAPKAFGLRAPGFADFLTACGRLGAGKNTRAEPMRRRGPVGLGEYGLGRPSARPPKPVRPDRSSTGRVHAHHVRARGAEGRMPKTRGTNFDQSP